MDKYVISIDINVRSGIFDLKGKMVCSDSQPILQFRPKENFVEQSSDDIW